jgi:hypothetical protein
MKNINNPEKRIEPEQVSQEAHRLLQLDTPPPPVPVKEQNPEPYPQNSAPLTDSFGRISLEESETTYVESTHWTAILDEVHFVLFPPM